MDSNANKQVNDIIVEPGINGWEINHNTIPFKEGYEKKGQESEAETSEKKDVKDSIEDVDNSAGSSEMWFFFDMVKTQAEKTDALLTTTYKMKFKFWKPSQELWVRTTDAEFKSFNCNTTYPIDVLVDMLVKLKSETTTKKDSVRECIKHLLSIRAVWHVKFEVMNFEEDAMNVNLHCLMLRRMRVRVSQLKLMVPKFSDPVVSCMLICNQILLHITGLCIELQELVTNNSWFKLPQEILEKMYYEGFNLSDEEEQEDSFEEEDDGRSEYSNE